MLTLAVECTDHMYFNWFYNIAGGKGNQTFFKQCCAAYFVYSLSSVMYTGQLQIERARRGAWEERGKGSSRRVLFILRISAFTLHH